MYFGIDVSDAQGPRVDFEAMARSEVSGRPQFRFAIVKATEGGDFQSKRFTDNWKKLLELDPARADPSSPYVIRGVYHFARPDNRASMSGQAAGETEADWFCDVVEHAGSYHEGCLPPFLDWEKRVSGSARNREWIAAFLNRVSDRLKRQAALYTGPNTWRITTSNWTGLQGKVPLWQVKYSRTGYDPTHEYPKPRLYDGGGKWPWQLWQWSAGGKYQYYNAHYQAGVPGVPSGVADVNRFDGSLDALRALALLDGENPWPVQRIDPSSTEPCTNDLTAGIMPSVDIRSFQTSERSQLVAVVQGLLMAGGHGPAGLVGNDGLPDGQSGSKTQQALCDYKQQHGLPADTILDAATWWSLLQQ